MPIKVWDYLTEYEQEKRQVHAAIDRVLTSGRLILGTNVKQFEHDFSAYCGCRYGVGVNSGTDALFLGLKALGIGPGDEVITVSNTAVPTVSAIVSTGAVPRFVDIDPATYLMDTSMIEDAVTRKTKCILPVHLYGQCADMRRIKAIARAHGLLVFEDCAQSHGALYYGKKAGSMGNASAFSFYPTKILGGFGDGGMVVTDNRRLYEKLIRLRFYGMKKTYYASEHGYNSRLDELHASILLAKLAHLDEYISRRIELAGMYDALLRNTAFALPATAPGNRHAFYLYVCRHPARDRIIEELKKRDIIVNISYPWPIHTMKGYRYLGYRKGDLPHTEKAAKEIFSLPMYPSLTDRQLMRVVDALKDILKGL
ncbi:MAG TPA: DegT/DnrJ/EryC1/StrS family aminotransferase [Candidatus Omnitrophota bacterium]|nr:DegT/DnrJ/EryC1/StrS family aminotransferase [Candidatus Omnitrophota bacterium]